MIGRVVLIIEGPRFLDYVDVMLEWSILQSLDAAAGEIVLRGESFPTNTLMTYILAVACKPCLL